jgi:transposase
MRLGERARVEGAGRVVCCYEAGRDGFWLQRYVEARGMVCRVIDPASLPVERRGRRAKSDRIDVRMLLRGLIGWESGDRGACRPVRSPTLAEEDARQVHREREALVGERGRHVNRIRALLATQGVSGFEPLRHGRGGLAGLRDSEGAPLPAALRARLEREFVRLDLVLEQIAAVEAAREAAVMAPAPPDVDAAKIVQLTALKGIGTQIATVLTRELLFRDFANRRQVGSYAGLTATPWRSGGMQREQGISKAGNPRARTVAIELAWLWLRWQPGSVLARWFAARVGTATGRLRRIAIVALARKLIVALWRYVETGLVPAGATLKA